MPHPGAVGGGQGEGEGEERERGGGEHGVPGVYMSGAHYNTTTSLRLQQPTERNPVAARQETSVWWCCPTLGSSDTSSPSTPAECSTVTILIGQPSQLKFLR